MPLESHPDVCTPPDETILWRYTDFAKFVDLLDKQSLWFSRPDQFEDPLEGTHTDAEKEHLLSLNNSGSPHPVNVSNGYLRGSRHIRMASYVSCWRAAAEESMAMWDLYGKGGTIAIKTTVQLLKTAINESSLRMFLGKVRYVSWSTAPWDNNLLAMCFRKDTSYGHESEVRAIIFDEQQMLQNMSDAVRARQQGCKQLDADMFLLGPSKGVRGVQVPFAIERFVSEVVVGPRGQDWIANLAQNLLKKYEFNIRVTSSNKLRPRS